MYPDAIENGGLWQLSAQEIADLCGVKLSTAKRWKSGKGIIPPPAQKLINLFIHGEISGDGEHHEVRENSRLRAVRLRKRMMMFNTIYNAAWHVRSSQHGAPDYRASKVANFVKVLREELQDCKDEEALIFAVANSLTSFPRGVPWEG